MTQLLAVCSGGLRFECDLKERGTRKDLILHAFAAPFHTQSGSYPAKSFNNHSDNV